MIPFLVRSLKYKQKPMWAESLQVGDIFYYHPQKRTYIVFKSDPALEGNKEFVSYVYTPLTELCFWLGKSPHLYEKCMSFLRRHGYCTSPTGIEPEFWPFIRTFTVDRKLRLDRLSRLGGFPSQELLDREKEREYSAQVVDIADSLREPPAHSYYAPHEPSPLCNPLCTPQWVAYNENAVATQS